MPLFTNELAITSFHGEIPLATLFAGVKLWGTKGNDTRITRQLDSPVSLDRGGKALGGFSHLQDQCLS
jgi:hypothetical protein